MGSWLAGMKVGSWHSRWVCTYLGGWYQEEVQKGTSGQCKRGRFVEASGKRAAQPGVEIEGR